VWAAYFVRPNELEFHASHVSSKRFRGVIWYITCHDFTTVLIPFGTADTSDVACAKYSVYKLYPQRSSI
jgi:hypothetical protein